MRAILLLLAVVCVTAAHHHYHHEHHVHEPDCYFEVLHKRDRRWNEPDPEAVYKTSYALETKHVREANPNKYKSHVYTRFVNGEMGLQDSEPIVQDDFRETRDTVGVICNNKKGTDLKVRTEKFSRHLEEPDQ